MQVWFGVVNREFDKYGILIYTHTMSMNTHRITISMPGHIYQILTSLVDKRGVSRYVSEAVEEKLLEKIKELPTTDL